MEILRPAVAGTLESSDCQVTVEEGEGKIELTLNSTVINQYGNQIKKLSLYFFFDRFAICLFSVSIFISVS